MSSPLLPTYARVDLAFDRGEGAWVHTVEGEAYLDFGSGIAVTALGHAHPQLLAAIDEASRRVWHVSNVVRIPEQERLAQRLVDNTFADVVFFANSGAEANEAAVKMARKYQSAKGAPERWRVLTFEGAFHGRTLAMIAAGGQQKYLDGFGPKVEGFDQVPFGDVEAARAAITPETAAILVEPVQGEGGIRPADPAFLRALRDLCETNGLLLIYDEVQTGVGRMGTFYAYEGKGVAPDILTTAKGLGGGFPIGACLATREAAAGMTVGTHGTTFGGNPMACAVAGAVLDVVLAPGFLDEVKARALRFKQKLVALKDLYPDFVEDIRGEGLLMGIKCRIPPAEAAAAFRKHKLLTIPAGDNVVRLLPPLIVSDADLDEALRRIEASLHDLSAAKARVAE